MKINRSAFALTFSFTVLLWGGVSCSLDDQEIPAEETYTREFIRQFGVFDKDHDWNLATRQAVTVNPGTGTGEAVHVKIYAQIGKSRYLFADYENVSSTASLPFDIPGSIKEVIVSVDGVEYTVPVGASLDLSALTTRTICDSSDDPIVKVETVNEWRYWTYEQTLRYQKMLPEEDAANKTKEEVNADFLLTATSSPFILYPTYYWTSNHNTCGIYYYKDGKKVEVPFYTQKQGEDFEARVIAPIEWTDKTKRPYMAGDIGDQVKDSNGNYVKFDQYTEADWNSFKQRVLGWVSGAKDPYVIIHSFDAENVEFTIMETKQDWTELTVERTDWPLGYEPKEGSIIDYRSKGIRIKIAENTPFGFYIQNSDGIFYSEKSLNEKDNSGNLIPHVCVYTDTDQLTNEPIYRLGFEDWKGNETADLNDMIFRMYGDQTLPLKPGDSSEEADKPFTWILACEDLGSTGDYDFNDVVFAVSHVAGSTEATVTALAAGGTLEVYLWYSNGTDTETDDVLLKPQTDFGGSPYGGPTSGEFHTWFKIADGSYVTDYTSMINTGPGAQHNNLLGASCTITVPADYAISSEYKTADDTPNYDREKVKAPSTMGGFYIKVMKNGKEIAEVTPPPAGGQDGETYSSIEAPQMICLPSTDISTITKEQVYYNWPYEFQSMAIAFPEVEQDATNGYGFLDWCRDHRTTDWWHHGAPSLLYGISGSTPADEVIRGDEYKPYIIEILGDTVPGSE